VPTFDIEAARSALASSYRALSDDLARLGPDDLARPSRCLGWTRDDLLYHCLLDAQRALVTFATPSGAEPDVDFVSYWRPYRPGAEGYDEHARFVRRAAASWPSGLEIARFWTMTAHAAAHAAGAVPGDLRVATQGHVLTAGDFMATLVTEVTIHHLDLSGDESGGQLQGPCAEGLAVVRQTLDGILGQPVPAGWDDAGYALKATGRAVLTDGDLLSLGTLAGRFPLLG
jgi:uncharacterized protein (TIGR03083 family)